MSLARVVVTQFLASRAQVFPSSAPLRVRACAYCSPPQDHPEIRSRSTRARVLVCRLFFRCQICVISDRPFVGRRAGRQKGVVSKRHELASVFSAKRTTPASRLHREKVHLVSTSMPVRKYAGVRRESPVHAGFVGMSFLTPRHLYFTCIFRQTRCISMGRFSVQKLSAFRSGNSVLFGFKRLSFWTIGAPNFRTGTSSEFLHTDARFFTPETPSGSPGSPRHERESSFEFQE